MEIDPVDRFQVKYSEMLSHVEPLENELKALELEANENRCQIEQTQTIIANLENSIGRCDEEYRVLFDQARTIETDLASVKTKVLSLHQNYVLSIVIKQHLLPLKLTIQSRNIMQKMVRPS